MPRGNNNQNNQNRRNKRNGRKANNVNRRRFGRGRGRMKIQTTRIFKPIMSDRTNVHLKVSSLVTFAFLSTSFYQGYKGNDLVNPGNGTWVNQPAGFIDWMQFYHRFRVLGSKITMQMINDGDNARNRGIWVCVYPTLLSDPSSLSGGYINAMAQPYARGRFVGAPTGQDKVTLVNFISTSKFWGSNVLFDDNFTGIVDTSPVNQWYWGIVCSGLSDGGTEYPILTFVVTIEYHCILYDRSPVTMTFPGLSEITLEKPYLQSKTFEHLETKSDEILV